MRALQAIAIIAVLGIGLGAKQFVFPTTEAEADVNAVSNASMNVLQMHFDHPNINNLPVEKIHDMTFIYSDSD